jgi:tetratricopeptide (TPR) repeat protein
VSDAISSQPARTRRPAAALRSPARWPLVGLTCWLGLWPSLSFANTSDAEPAPAPLTQIADVEEHVRRAAAMYRAGDFLEAANELSIAYTMQPQPVFLFNIAQAYRKALHARAAIAMYQRFIEVAPTNALAIDAQGHIQDMEALARAEESAAEARRQLESERNKASPLYRRAWFWGVLGGVTGAAALAIGLGVGLSHRDPPTSGGFVNLSF